MSRRLKKQRKKAIAAAGADEAGSAMGRGANGAVEGARRRGREVAGVCILLVMLVFIVYGQTLHFGFVNYDDDTNVYQAAEVTAGISAHGLAWAFTHAQVNRWAPIATISRQIDCQFHGLRAGGHHLTNVLLHAAASVLLFLVLQELTGWVGRSGFVAAAFAVHPLHVECVAWVSARGELLGGVFFLLSLWSYAIHARRPGRRFQYGLSILWFSLGLMSKSTIVTLPCVLLLLDFWPLGRLREKSQLRSLLVEKLPFLALSAASCAASVMAQEGGVLKHGHYSLPARVENALVSYAIYLGKTIYPARLAVLYPLLPNGWPAWEATGAALLLIALTSAAVFLRRKQPWLLMGWLWYAGMLVPMAGILQAGDAAYADRYTYLPQTGLWIAGTWGAASWAHERRGLRVALGCVGLAIVGAFTVAAYRQTTYWRESASLWSHTLDCTTGNYTAHNNFGNALADEGREQEAMAQYREAVRINPSDPDALANLARLLFKEGETGEAMAQYQEALRINPESAPIHEYLGMDLFRMGRVNEAAGEFREALRIDPEYADAHICLGNVMLSQGRAEDAMAEYRSVLQIDPADTLAGNNICRALILLFQQGHAEEAAAEARQTLELAPGNTIIRNALERMTAPGDGTSAIQH